MDIFEAAFNNDAATIKEYLKFGDVNVVDKNNNSLLHYAARTNSVEVANLLLDNYINLNIINDKGETPLFEAVSRSHLGLCKILCRYHADFNVVNRVGETIYFKAVLKGRRDIISLLEDSYNIDYLFHNANNENILFYALKAYNNDLFIEMADSYPILIKSRNYAKINLLMLALQYNNEEIIDYLIDKFDNYYERDFNNNNILFYAARYSSALVMKKLLKKMPIIAGKNKDGEDIFTVSSYNSNSTLTLLENYKDSYEYKLYTKTYPFHIAVVDTNYDLLDLTNPDIKKRDTQGISILDLIKMVDDPNIYKIFNLKRQ